MVTLPYCVDACRSRIVIASDGGLWKSNQVGGGMMVTL
ncbi:MAG: hypothetical protein RL285_1484 [Bacteroidota bacterium]